MEEKSKIGLIGLAVMGENLALNIDEPDLRFLFHHALP